MWYQGLRVQVPSVAPLSAALRPAHADRLKHHPMTDDPAPQPPQQARGYGVLMALGILLGIIFGLFIGEPSAGAAGGLALGLLAAVIFWLKDR